MTCSEIKREARNSLQGNWGKSVLIVLAYIVVVFVVNFVLELLPQSNKIMAIISVILNALINVPLTFGFVFSFIKLKRNEEVSPIDFVVLGFSNFGKCWRVALSIVVRLILPIILSIIAVMMLGFSIYSAAGASIDGSSSSFASVISFLGIILYFVALIYLFIRSVALSLSFYLAYDEPELGGMDTTKKSLKLMKGHVGKAILLSLSFIGWILLLLLPIIIVYIYYSSKMSLLYFVSAPASMFKLAGAFSVIIPIYMAIVELFLIPYMQVSLVCFYENITGNVTPQPIVDENGREEF